jgi:hypothetical protein
MSILRPEKRDPNSIRNKSDIGLSKVDNISSAEFTSIILDQVKRHINRETIFTTSGRRYIALAKITCKDDGSGNLTKVLSGNLFITFAALNESEDVQEAVKLETIYSHYINGSETNYEDDTADVEYNIFMTENPALLNECYLEFRENMYEDPVTKAKIAEMYVVLRCDNANLPLVSVNLFEYSNGGVALDPSAINEQVISSYDLIKSAKLDHNRFSLVDRSEATVGFEIYDENGSTIRVKDNDGSSETTELDSNYQIPTINEVHFTGRRNVTVNGKSTRNITITAKHAGSDKDRAGIHEWEVIPYAPRTGYTYEDEKKILQNNTYPTLSFLDKDNFYTPTTNGNNNIYEYHGYGLCRIASIGNINYEGITLPNIMIDPERSLAQKIRYLYEWSDSISKVDSDVIPVRIFKTFTDSTASILWEILKNTKKLSEIAKKIPKLETSELEALDKFLTSNSTKDELGYHYIFDFARTSDSITRVSYSGTVRIGEEDRNSVTYDIRLGFTGYGPGTSIDVDDYEAHGEVESFVRISQINREPEGFTSITFTFTANDTSKPREGYYVINSDKIDNHGSRIKLTYRFYQDVVESSLRVCFNYSNDDKGDLPEIYALGARVKKAISNKGSMIEFKKIRIVDVDRIDLSGNPIVVDEGVLVYGIEVKDGGDGISVISEKTIYSPETHSLNLGLSITHNIQDYNKTFEVYIYKESKYEKNRILTIQLTQKSRDFEFEAPDTITVKGRKGETVPFEIKSNKDWTIDLIEGKDYIEITDKEGNDGLKGVIPESAGTSSYVFERVLKALKDNPSSRIIELGILKLYSDKDESKFKKIQVYQEGMPATINIPKEITIPANKGESVKISDFVSSHDWKIIVDSDLAVWCTIKDSSGNTSGGMQEDMSNLKPTTLIFTTNEQTDARTRQLRGTFKIQYAEGKYEETILVYQAAGKFNFSIDSRTGNLYLGCEINSSLDFRVRSNYEWYISLEHNNAGKPMFDISVDDPNNGNLSGKDLSRIYIKAKYNNDSSTEDKYLGSIKFIALGEEVPVTTQTGTSVKKFEIWQNKTGLSITIKSVPGWYADGASKNGSESNIVNVPVQFTPSTGVTVTATYTIDGGEQKTAEVNNNYANIVLPAPGKNKNGNKNRVFKVTATAKLNSNNDSITGSCDIIQDKYNNGITINGDPYYGGTREGESLTVPAIAQETNYKNVYKATTGDLVVNENIGWLTATTSSLTTIYDNTSLNRSGTITLTAGSGHDMTEATINVTQLGVSWTFEATSGYSSGNGSVSNPYIITDKISSVANNNSATVNINSYYTTNGINTGDKPKVSQKPDYLDCRISEDSTTGKYRLTIASNTNNTDNSEKTGTIIIINSNNSSLYFSVTQEKVSGELFVHGGVKGIDYIFTTSSTGKTLTTQQSDLIKNNKNNLVFTRNSDDTILSGSLIDIKYFDLDNNKIKSMADVVDKNVTLYVNNINYSGTTITSLSTTYSKAYNNGIYDTIANFKVRSGTNHVYIQRYKIDRINVEYGLGTEIENLHTGSLYILVKSGDDNVQKINPESFESGNKFRAGVIDTRPNNNEKYDTAFFAWDSKEGGGMPYIVPKRVYNDVDYSYSIGYAKDGESFDVYWHNPDMKSLHTGNNPKWQKLTTFSFKWDPSLDTEQTIELRPHSLEYGEEM